MQIRTDFSSGRFVRVVASFALLLTTQAARSQFIAFNDHAPGTLGVTTSSNATTWNVMGNSPGASGALKDVNTGATLPVVLTITRSGTVNGSASAGNPSPGTPLYDVFNGYVDFQGAGDADAAVQVTGSSTVTYTFTGLVTNRLYSFKGSAVRGGVGGTYPQRWSLFELDGARAFSSAHTAGCYTNGLATNQVAVNTGVNTNGDMADWESIVPGTNGSIAVTTTQYTGPIPPTNGPANGPYCYALSGFRLQEFNGPAITSAASVGENLVRVVFSIPVQPASATNLANYTLTNASGTVGLLGAIFYGDNKTIQLTTASQLPNALQSLTVNGVADAATGATVIATNSQVVYTNLPFTMGYVQRQLYFAISNSTAVSSLTNSPKFPNNPDQVDYPPSMGWPQENIADNYGGRFSGWLVPPLSGFYYFALRSDDSSQFYLSTNDNPAFRAMLLNEPNCCEAFDAHTNGPFLLNAGQRYYFDALMKEGGGGDYLYVAWKTPTNLAWTVIPGTFLGNYLYATNSSLTMLQQPASLTAMAGQRAVFSVTATGSSSITTNVSYQWQLNGFDLPGATGPTYTTPVLHESDSGSVYRVLAAVPGKAQFSTNAVLTVVPDTVPPTVVRVFNVGPTNVQFVFSEPVEPATATNTANYVFSGALAARGAALDASFTNLLLNTTALVYGSNYSVVINRVRDQAANPNTIATNTLVSFVGTPFASQDIGNAALASASSYLTNGVNVSAAGSDFGGFSDQGTFNYLFRSGNFDICARLASLGLSDLWAKAGLMARETLDAPSRFAAVFATPGMNGAFFEYRDPAYSPAVSAGNFPANYPYTWLRLTRVGNLFTGYAGYDGQTWTLLGSDSITLPTQLYLGLAVSSHNSAQATSSQFRDMADVTNAIVGVVTNPHEPIGPSSRKSPVAISEIMYKPAPRSDGLNLEFLELYNSNPWFQDISGYQILADNMSYAFPPGTVLAGGAYLVVAAAPADIQAVSGIINVTGPYTGSLKSSGTLQLLDEVGAVLLTIPYSNQAPWPAAADGAGHSLVLAYPSYGEEDPRAWDISDVVGGSPGAMEAYRPSPLRNVVINEFLAHTDPPQYDYIELYNHANQPVDISGCILSDDPVTNKFVVPAGTVLPARGFVYYSETNMNFRLLAAGETIYFKNPDASRVLDSVEFGGQQNGVAMGRWPDGAGDYYRLTANTPGAPNAGLLLSDVVLNELMYNPISGDDDDQYIELYNRSTNTVNLSNWQLEDAVSFTFPTNTLLAPDSYLVVARNAARLMSNYPNLNPANTLGDFSGKLSHNGERLALSMPDYQVVTNTGGQLETNVQMYIAVNEVTYGTGGRWGQWASGGGSSLELLDPNANTRLAQNWGDSDETHKSAWTNIETTGVLDNGHNYDPSIDYAQIGLLDVGECLVDNIEVHPGTQTTNFVANPDFESGLTNWTMQGCQIRSSLENEGFASSHSLHIRCSDRFWTGDNSCELKLTTNSLAAGQTATLRFKARWLRGWPEPILRLNGNWLEATGTLPLPANLGTPGARNSRYVTNAGPAIYQVTHSPAVPASNQVVVVTARVHAPHGLQSLALNYRVDPALTYTVVPFKDDGTGGDAVANDGLFSATIPAPNANKIVAFYLSATDALGMTTRFPVVPNNNFFFPPECVVMFGDSNPGGSFSVYHLWITQTNATLWSNQSDLSNESWDCTMVNNNRIIYNAQGRFAGSPYHQGFNTPYGNLCHYKWIFPDDDKFLGATSFNKIHQPGNGAGDDASIQREQIANSFLRTLGVPWLSRRYVAVYVNGNRRGTLMEDAQCPDADVVKEHWPDDADGWLYKMQPWFEFGPAPSGSSTPFQNYSWCTIVPYTTTGGIKKTARYRYPFLARRTPVSANDFTNVFSLVDAASSFGTPSYEANMQNLADMENWMRVAAANHAAGNWDSFLAQNGQNLYGYIGAQGTKYSLLMWDFNIVLGNSGSWGPGQNLFAGNAQDPNATNIWRQPVFRRMYWRALGELVTGPLDVANSGPLMDAKYASFVANGLSVEDPNTSIKTWLTQARNSIRAQMTAENTATFTVASASVVNNTLVVSGRAPFSVKTLWFNGVEWPVTWTSVTGWTVTLPLKPGDNEFSVLGVDRHGQPVPGATGNVGVTYNGSSPSPVGQVVINEIMYNPPAANAQYVELYNNSTTTTFDLSGWQFHGLAYTFPPGSLLGPSQFLVLAANRASYAAAYGATNAVFDTFGGTLQPDGETLTLIQPGTNSAFDLVIAKVRYSSYAPWPAGANGLGSSLQLIAPQLDNWRAGNWAGAFPPASLSPGAPNTVQAAMPAFPPLWLNELQADNLTGLTNSAGARTAWLELFNPSSNSVSLAGIYLANNYTNLTAWAFPAGAAVNPGELKIIFADGLTNLSTLSELHTSFALSSGAGSVALTRLYNSQLQVLDYLDYTNLTPNRSFGSFPDGQAFTRQEFYYVTPGASNNGTSAPLSVRINEWMAGNTHTLANPVTGKYSDWFELYNYGTNSANLAGYFLTDSLTNQFKDEIPAGYVIPPHGFLLVWADGKSTNGTPDLHVSFKLSKAGESLGLYGADGTPVDYLSYGPQSDDISEGRFPDGADALYFMPTPTPRTNNIVPNTPPILNPINNRWLTLGQTLGLTASATDLDQPPQVLSFSLGPNPPPGAAINPANGFLTWTPTNAPATNQLSIIVTDNGTPSLSATQSFTVTVLLPPRLAALNVDGARFAFSWQTVPAQNYQLEYTDELQPGTWTPVGTTIAGTGSLLTLTNNLSLSTHRFYRLLLLP